MNLIFLAAGSDSDADENLAFDDSSEDENVEISSRWKTGMSKKASEMFYSKMSTVSNLRRLIYQSDPELIDGNEEEDTLGGLFRVVRKFSETSGNKKGVNASESTKAAQSLPANFDEDQLKQRLRRRFAAKKTGSEVDQGQSVKGEEDDDEVFGDFEDLETGKIFASDKAKDVDEVVSQRSANWLVLLFWRFRAQFVFILWWPFTCFSRKVLPSTGVSKNPWRPIVIGAEILESVI